MSPFVFKLCGTPVVGFFAGLGHLCVIPPLVNATNVSLAPATCSIDTNVTTPVPARHGYQPWLTLSRNNAREIPGSGKTIQPEGANPSAKTKPVAGDVQELGPEQQLAFEVTIADLTDGHIVWNSVVRPSSKSAWTPTEIKYQLGGLIWLVPGRYHIAICTLGEGPRDPASKYQIDIR